LGALRKIRKPQKRKTRIRLLQTCLGEKYLYVRRHVCICLPGKTGIQKYNIYRAGSNLYDERYEVGNLDPLKEVCSIRSFTGTY
jgi:hypothetical protein